MTSAEIRQSFLDFFREKDHTIVPSASLLPDSPNLLFTNAGMNQFVPIFLGQQKPPWNPPRVVDTQKCIRAGGKHNDLDDVGLDTYHHTFFEMLGNWSFGDYFKKEAIEWAWELVVWKWKFPPERVYATVYCPHMKPESWAEEMKWVLETVRAGYDLENFDQQDEFFNEKITGKPAFRGELKDSSDLVAMQEWARFFFAKQLDPVVHIIPGNKKDNFWMMGETGPCGPCSELHIDLTPEDRTPEMEIRGSKLVNAGVPECIEIWNLVFIQFNANPDGTLSPLPARHVDTGMGFERVTAMIQGTKNFTDFSRPISNYETDVFRPIFDEIEKLSGKRYGFTLPRMGSTGESEQERVDIAFRVIADHIRTLSFAIADGIQPGNTDRHYVLRRILRRAVRYGRTLGFHESFFCKLVGVLARTMGDVFPEIRAKQRHIEESLKREEEAFNITLDRGIELFNAELKELEDSAASFALVDGKMVPGKLPAQLFLKISGDFAFKLYDTYGFPFDLTVLMAKERGFTIDRDGFDQLMEEQRARARAAQKKQVIEVSEIETKEPTQFVGYGQLEAVSKVQEILSIKDRAAVVLAVSPCYAEMGGQVGDTGTFETSDVGIAQFFQITDTQKIGGTMLHFISSDLLPSVGSTAIVRVDGDRRHAIERHHTVTHILHWALHELVSGDATQKGSYVGPDKLTFDFSSAALTSQQKRDLEKLVNEKISENALVTPTEISYADAKKRSDIQQFFGDKYGEKVRVVQIGGDAEALNGYSMELCGGTHVRVTGDIGSFRIVREEAIAAGIRRIEAVAGDAARDWAKTEAVKQQEKFEALARKKDGIAALPAFADDAETKAMLEQVDARAAHLEKLEAEVHEWEKQHAKASEADLKSRAGTIANELAEAHAGEKSCVAEVPNADAKLLQAIVDALKSKFSGPIFLAGAADGRVALIASVPKELTSKIQANKLIQEVAPIVGGKGGGRPEGAQGAGKDASKIGEALARARELISL
jgi:alanyl-tRNA synthetase